MANTKISALTALTAAGTATDDEIAIVDTSVTTTKKQTIAQARISFGPQLGTEQASTSGTSIDFTGIPAGVKRITVMLDGVSTNGSTEVRIQIGDSGGFEISGYVTSSDTTVGSLLGSDDQTDGWHFRLTATAAVTITGVLVLTLMDTSNTWIGQGLFTSRGAGAVEVGRTVGSKTLSAELTQIRITANGTDTFDAGAINISYE